MIASRRCISVASPQRAKPSPSGPRCRSAWATARSASSRMAPAGSSSAAMPHTAAPSRPGIVPARPMPGGGTRAARAVRVRPRVRILFLTTLMPGALSSGSEVASQGFVHGLRALGHEVTLIGYRRAGDSPPLHPDDVVVSDRHIETDRAGARAALWMARALATRQPYSVAKYVSRAYRRAVAEALLRGRPQLVVVDHAQMGWAAPPGVPSVLLSHNVEHRLYEELAAEGGA